MQEQKGSRNWLRYSQVWQCCEEAAGIFGCPLCIPFHQLHQMHCASPSVTVSITSALQPLSLCVLQVHPRHCAAVAGTVGGCQWLPFDCSKSWGQQSHCPLCSHSKTDAVTDCCASLKISKFCHNFLVCGFSQESPHHPGLTRWERDVNTDKGRQTSLKIPGVLSHLPVVWISSRQSTQSRPDKMRARCEYCQGQTSKP